MKHAKLNWGRDFPPVTDLLMCTRELCQQNRFLRFSVCCYMSYLAPWFSSRQTQYERAGQMSLCHGNISRSERSLTSNVGVIGLGKMGILHSGIINSLPDARVKAICERESFLVKAAKAFLPNTVAFYTDHLEMLDNEELDAVLVTSPIHTHVPLVLDIARTNKYLSIFVEKPLASTLTQAESACEAVRSLRGVHMVGFQKRFSRVFQRAREFIEKGLIGDFLFFRAYSFSSDVLRRGTSWRFQRGTGGVLLDLAPHLLDILLWFFGEPEGVESFSRRFYSEQVDDYVHAIMSYESGLRGTMDMCWSIKNFRLPEISIEVFGKRGILTVCDDFVRLASGEGIGKSQTLYRQSFDTSVPFLLADPEFTMEDVAFISSARNKTKSPCDFFEGAKVNAIIDQINERIKRTERWQ
jgi:predicted dehydrogenase